MSLIRCRILQDIKLGVESQGPVPSVHLVDECLVLLARYGRGKDAHVWRPHEPEPHFLHGFARWVVCWCGMSALLKTKHLTHILLRYSSGQRLQYHLALLPRRRERKE